MRRPQIARALVSVGLIVSVVVLIGPAERAAPVEGQARGAAATDWVWPVSPFRVGAVFVQPAHRYGPGHRGIDLQPLDGDAVRAPAAGVIAFAGEVAGRAVVTIDHGDGLVTTLEPVRSGLTPGSSVERDALVGELSAGGHTPPGMLHFGVRLAGEYVNPLLLLGGVPRAVLLPCCD